MKILDMPCTKGFMQIAQDGVDKGWHEMNGGNLSYRLTEDEAANVKKVQRRPAGDWQEIGESVPRLAGAFFMVTRTTGYMRNVMRDPLHAFGIVELDSTGTKYRIWWGLADGGRPTSEFPSHLKNHEVKLETTGGEHRVIYHAHPVNLIALTFVLPPTDRAFTRALWEIMTECPVIFPEGVGVVPWMVPGKARSPRRPRSSCATTTSSCGCTTGSSSRARTSTAASASWTRWRRRPRSASARSPRAR